MSNIGRTVKHFGKPLGVIVGEVKIRGKAKYKVALDASQPRNPVLGDFTIVGLACEFMDDEVFAPIPGGGIDFRIIARSQSYNR